VKRMLDLFAGRLGWSKAFLARGWEVTAVDLVEPPEIPAGVTFINADVMDVEYSRELGEWILVDDLSEGYQRLGKFDFGAGSSPCEEFAVWGMRHFHPNPQFPEGGVRLFNHTRCQFEKSGIPYVMENVRAARQFVGPSEHRCGPFHIWGKGVPPLMPQGITKGFGAWDRKYILTTGSSKSKRRKELKAKWAEIPPELANCVAEYAEWLVDHKASAGAIAGSSGHSDG